MHPVYCMFIVASTCISSVLMQDFHDEIVTLNTPKQQPASKGQPQHDSDFGRSHEEKYARVGQGARVQPFTNTGIDDTRTRIKAAYEQMVIDTYKSDELFDGVLRQNQIPTYVAI
jgi:hypothetical protein